MPRKKLHAFRSDRVYLLPVERLHADCPTCAQIAAALRCDPYGRRTIPLAALDNAATIQHLEREVLGRPVDLGDPNRLANLRLDDWSN